MWKEVGSVDEVKIIKLYKLYEIKKLEFIISLKFEVFWKDL